LFLPLFKSTRSDFGDTPQYHSALADAAKVVREIEELGNGVKAVALQADIGDVSQAKKLVDDTVTKLGRLDVLVNNV
jgi:NAD(P)-dependent dehydrogenase (short-subunit alcohol dehydrogenase family)